MRLRAKINAYAGYVLDGGLAAAYPETVGHLVAIRLDWPDEPQGQFAQIADFTTARPRTYRIGLRIKSCD